MNIVREDLGNLTSLLRVTVSEADYGEAVEKTLREYKRKANVPGFRPGMVPMGVVNKMYRKGVVAEEAYKKASDECFKYLEANKVATVGDLLPSEAQQPLDFDGGTEYEFVFEYGQAPEVKIELSKKDKVTNYKIKVNAEMHDGYRSNYLRRFGRLVDVEKVEKEEALNVTLDNESMNIAEAYVGLISMDDAQRAPFIGKQVGDVMQVNVNELYPTPSQRASILQIKENELGGIDPNFTLTITKIRKFAEPELGDEFFKTAFPEGDVKNGKEFDAFIDTQVSAELLRESEYLLGLEMKKFLLEKANLRMPDEFLRRWLYTINEGRFSMEEIERDFPQFIDMMRWNIVVKHYVDALHLDVTPEEALEEAKTVARAQFAQYGMASVPDDTLAGYANSMLGNKEEAKKIYDRLYERKVIEGALPQVTVTDKSVSVEEFGKVVESLQQ